MITSEKILTVIGYLKNALPLAIRENHLEMMQANVCAKGIHQCGTSHCHAGWYLIGKMGKDSIIKRERSTAFSEGADKMAEDLGFSNRYGLTRYFEQEEKLWGGKFAIGMFCDVIAFAHPTKRPNGAENLQHIIDHWTEVYERFLVMEGKEVEQKEKIRYVSVPSSITEQTKELIMQ